MNLYRRLLWAGLLLGIVVVGLGAFTRLTEAGLGCPDWPGCYGFLTVPMGEEALAAASERFPNAPVEADKAWYEMVHRYFAGALGVLILGLFVVAWREQRKLTLPAVLLGTVIFQAALGMWTVTMNLNPLIVMGHLLGGFLTVSLLAWQLFSSYRIRRRFPPLGYLRWLGLAAGAAVLLQIALGGWTSANYAATVCTQLPWCETDWVSSYDTSAFDLVQPEHESYQYGVLDYHQRVTIHVTHRIGAVVVSVLLLSYLLLLARRGVAWRYWVPALGCLALQVGLGINNVVSMLPLANAVAHNLVGLALLLTTLLSLQPTLATRRLDVIRGGIYGKA
uniref:COX15/CtaA family protein n=1 Tax=Thaumasiovibrio occultus TaxID=1891184 RepID=UPI000B35140D|nr:COX15/CtaA family protein [Thaumasiovibrio occultus]